MVAAVSPAFLYRRQARRLRFIHANEPSRLHAALLELAKQTNRQERAATVPEPTSAVRHFATSVASALEGPVLRYSARRRLIHEAESLGIRRFDANLLIAAVQHRMVQHHAKSRVSVLPPAAKRWPAWAIPAGVLLSLEGAIFIAGYLLVRG